MTDVGSSKQNKKTSFSWKVTMAAKLLLIPAIGAVIGDIFQNILVTMFFGMIVGRLSFSRTVMHFFNVRSGAERLGAAFVGFELMIISSICVIGWPSNYISLLGLPSALPVCLMESIIVISALIPFAWLILLYLNNRMDLFGAYAKKIYNTND